MDIKRNRSQASGKGPADWFTGTVRLDPLFAPTGPARAGGVIETFEPGARTAWHSHPLGQTLIVTAGCGRVQGWGVPIEEVRPGDVIWFSPGVKDNFDVEAAGLSVGKDGCSSDCKASESSWKCERERACCATPTRSDTLWRRR